MCTLYIHPCLCTLYTHTHAKIEVKHSFCSHPFAPCAKAFAVVIHGSFWSALSNSLWKMSHCDTGNIFRKLSFQRKYCLVPTGLWGPHASSPLCCYCIEYKGHCKMSTHSQLSEPPYPHWVFMFKRDNKYRSLRT